MTPASQITYFHLVATAQRQTQKSRLHYSQFTSLCVPFFCRFLKLRFYVAELSAEMPGICRLQHQLIGKIFYWYTLPVDSYERHRLTKYYLIYYRLRCQKTLCFPHCKHKCSMFTLLWNLRAHAVERKNIASVKLKLRHCALQVKGWRTKLTRKITVCSVFLCTIT